MLQKAQEKSKYISYYYLFLITEFPKLLILQYMMFGLLRKAEI